MNGNLVTKQNNEILQENLGENELLNLMKKNSDSKARELVKYEDAIKFNVLPLTVLKNNHLTILTVASNDRLTRDALESLKFLTNLDIKDILVKSSNFHNIIFSVYHSDENIIKESITNLENTAKANEKVEKIEEKTFFKQATNDEGRFLEDILKYAISIDASDLHIIPTQSTTLIKLRVNRNFVYLNDFKLLKSQHVVLIRRIKVLSKLELDKRDFPQDGSFIIPELKNISVRVSLMPTIFGEKAVLRFHSYKSISNILDLGISKDVIYQIKDFLDLKGGAMLCAGPTGSGKTTTLYAMINYLKDKGLNVVTIEDPVELAIDGISQTSLNVKRGFDYKDALCAILRQDPDVIMLGEVRDKISAGYLLQAVFSGHKVISTIHAGNVVEIFLRLKSLSVNTIDMAQALKFLSYQELLPKLCLNCAEKEKEISKLLGIDVYKSNGCTMCDKTGANGKILAFETLTIDSQVKDILLNNQILTQENIKNIKNYYSFQKYLYNLLKDKMISAEVFGHYFT